MSTFTRRWLPNRRRLRELTDRADICEVLRRLATATDRRQFELMRSCYHPGAFDDHGEWTGTVEQLVEVAPEFLGQFQSTMHMLGMPSIALDGDVAEVETYALAYHRRVGRADGVLKDDVWGVRYTDRFERRNGEWRIARRVMTRDWRRVDPV
jgi:hypothetical protein